MTTGLDASFAAYASFTFLLAATPGSTTAVVVRNTLEGGRRSGLAAALGAAVANTTHATLAGVGLSVLITTFPGIVQVVRVAGAVYLAWLGATSLRNAWRYADGGITFNGSPTSVAIDGLTLESRKGFREGLAINLLNPTIISFYVAIVPSFVPAGAPRFYFPLLAATHVTIALACHSTWATALGAVRRWFAPPPARRTLEACTGVALVALALRVVMS